MLLLTPEGEVRDFCYTSATTEQALTALWAIARLGVTVLSARLTDQTGTHYLNPSLVNDPGLRQALAGAADLLAHSK